MRYRRNLRNLPRFRLGVGGGGLEGGSGGGGVTVEVSEDEAVGVITLGSRFLFKDIEVGGAA